MIEKLLNQIFKLNTNKIGYIKITRIDDDSVSVKMINKSYKLIKKKGMVRYQVKIDELIKGIKDGKLLLPTDDELAKILLSGIDW